MKNHDEEDKLLVPAGPLRITLGSILLFSALFVAPTFPEWWGAAIALVMMIGGICLMLKNPSN
jgi:hypothetical protein